MSTRTSAAVSEADVFELDLSVLAYHGYNQTLLWPLDPWYEAWARPGSARRQNVLDGVHRQVGGRLHLRGPGSTRGWPANAELDPIVSDYSLLRPWIGCITDDGIAFRYFAAQPSIMSSITEVQVCEYTNHDGRGPRAPAITATLANPTAGAADRLYFFEGGSGSIDGSPPAWSLFGLVLDRTTADGYEVHIVYRGSQSGDPYRAAFEGMVLEAGNPDWVTDMELRKTVTDRRVSPHGEIVLGIRDCMLSSVDTLQHCLQDIAARHDGRPPGAIRLAGHSLGGALAAQLASALVMGSIGDDLPPSVADWPWNSLVLTTFGAPKVGDSDFAEHFDRTVSARRIWVDGDPITEFPLHAHVGEPVEVQSHLTGNVNHETFTIRQALIDAIAWHSDRTGSELEVGPHPWRAFDDLGEALLAAEADGTPIAELAGPDIDDRTELFAEIAATVVAEPSSYRLGFFRPQPELRRRAARIASQFAGTTSDPSELARRLKGFRSIQPGSRIETQLRRVFAFREAARNGWPASQLLDDADVAAALGTYRRPLPPSGAMGQAVAHAVGPPPNDSDVRRLAAVLRMRSRHHDVVNDGTVKGFRRRVPPTSGMPHVVRACSHYPGMAWLPEQLVVPKEMPEEAELLTSYKLKYYGLGKLGWALYHKWPIRPEVPWRPDYEWNKAFPPTGDGWEHPTADDTFVRLRLQGPNPFMLRRVDDHFALDFSDLFDGLLPPIVARFDLTDHGLTPRNISIGPATHRPGDPTWDRAKRVVNAIDVRVVPFSKHLLDVHFVVGQAFALATYALPTWHPLRPFMQFFSYGTMQVNDFAYKAFFKPSSYFIASGFVTPEAARVLFTNRLRSFDIDEWIPSLDIAERGIADIPGHPYVADATLVWPEFVAVVERHLDELGYDDEVIAADNDLQTWHLTLAKFVPNLDARDRSLDRQRLVELCSAFLWNNVVHEICGDMSPILGSEDPDDRAMVHLDRLIEAIGDGSLTTPIAAPTMADVFLMDQASYTSRFNVGGNNLLTINAAKWVDDPKLRDAIIDLQSTLRGLEAELLDRNRDRSVRFARMLPSNWEASVSF